jgi:alpha-glucosidase
MALKRLLLLFTPALAVASSLIVRDATDPLAACPGYKASNVQTTSSGLTADLTLAGTACNAYGTDLKDLVLQVTYEEGLF